MPQAAQSLPDGYIIEDFVDRGCRDLLREILGDDDYEKMIEGLVEKFRPTMTSGFGSTERMKVTVVLHTWLLKIHTGRATTTSKKLAVMHSLELYADMINVLF